MEIPARFCCDVRTQKLFRSKHAHKHKNKYVLKLDMSLLNGILSALKRTFHLTEESNIHTFLGINLTTTSEGNITLTQE